MIEMPVVIPGPVWWVVSYIALSVGAFAAFCRVDKRLEEIESRCPEPIVSFDEEPHRSGARDQILRVEGANAPATYTANLKVVDAPAGCTEGSVHVYPLGWQEASSKRSSIPVGGTDRLKFAVADTSGLPEVVWCSLYRFDGANIGSRTFCNRGFQYPGPGAPVEAKLTVEVTIAPDPLPVKGAWRRRFEFTNRGEWRPVDEDGASKLVESGVHSPKGRRAALKAAREALSGDSDA